MSQNRDLTDPVARSAAGAACIIQYRDECETRAEVDCWTEGWTPDSDTTEARAIDRHVGRVVSAIFTRSHE